MTSHKNGSTDQKKYSRKGNFKSSNIFTGLATGPVGPGRKRHLQGSGTPHDKWKGGAQVLPSTGLGGPLQNLKSGEVASPVGRMKDGTEEREEVSPDTDERHDHVVEGVCTMDDGVQDDIREEMGAERNVVEEMCVCGTLGNVVEESQM